jgi:hypothetical protein
MSPLWEAHWVVDSIKVLPSPVLLLLLLLLCKPHSALHHYSSQTLESTPPSLQLLLSLLPQYVAACAGPLR